MQYQAKLSSPPTVFSLFNLLKWKLLWTTQSLGNNTNKPIIWSSPKRKYPQLHDTRLYVLNLINQFGSKHFSEESISNNPLWLNAYFFAGVILGITNKAAVNQPQAMFTSNNCLEEPDVPFHCLVMPLNYAIIEYFRVISFNDFENCLI